MKPNEVLNVIVSGYKNAAAFARALNVDATEVSRWRSGIKPITVKAILRICELHPEIIPHDLKPEIFPPHLRLSFIKDNLDVEIHTGTTSN